MQYQSDDCRRSARMTVAPWQRLALLGLGLVLSLCLVPADAQQRSTGAAPPVRIDEVRRTPLPNLLEVRVGHDIFYVDDKAQFILLQGELIDMKSNRNITRERLEDVLAIDFNTLPMDLAFKQVVGNGKRRFAVFEDPNCGYCRKLRADLVKLDNVTIYTFVYSILGGDSDLKARKILCSADKPRAWNEMMLTGKIPGNGGTCSNQLEKIRALGGKLSVSATPTIFFADGRRLAGYVPSAQFEKMLNEHSAN
jgi:thiol:disulfide interchange protein DsbC